MPRYTWVAEAVPSDLDIRQVYCVMFDRLGRIMLRAEIKPGGIRFSLAGGRPESFDIGMEDTCRRELLEEVNTEIETPVFIGYQLVSDEDGSPAYAQVRMAAMIRKIGIRKPDPDNGITYGRFLASPEKASLLLNWGEVGYQQIMAARNTIYRRYGIQDPVDEEEWV